jgi:hypothetical protein
VKISRDGTEVEPSVGARLLKEFDHDLIASMPMNTPVQNPSSRRLSYPATQYRSLPPNQFVYQQQPAQAQVPQAHGYIPYSVHASQPVMYNYVQHRGMPQQPPQQVPYGQFPPGPQAPRRQQ